MQAAAAAVVLAVEIGMANSGFVGEYSEETMKRETIAAGAEFGIMAKVAAAAAAAV